MKLYRFSPIQSEKKLLEAITYIHLACHQLCQDSFGRYLPVAGNVGVFCHYPEEFDFLKGVRNKICEPSDNPTQKYFQLRQPITIPAKSGIPETIYTYLYIRKPDIYRAQIGDIDFYLPQEQYDLLKISLQNGTIISGARIFERPDLDMIELYNPDVDALAYVSTNTMTEKVRIKIAGGPTDLS